MEASARSRNANSIRFFRSPDGSSTIPSRSLPPRYRSRRRGVGAKAGPRPTRCGCNRHRQSARDHDRMESRDPENLFTTPSSGKTVVPPTSASASARRGPRSSHPANGNCLLWTDRFLFSGQQDLVDSVDNVPGTRSHAEAGKLAFGTVDSWLLWKLTSGRVHVTDASNASRTMLFNIHTGAWDHELLDLFRVPLSHDARRPIVERSLR